MAEEEGIRTITVMSLPYMYKIVAAFRQCATRIRYYKYYCYGKNVGNQESHS